MPTYEYLCGKCHQVFERVSSISDRRDKSPCDVCGSLSSQFFGNKAFSFQMGVIEPYYDYGLGEIITGNLQRQDLIRQKGLVEIGNEVPVSKRDFFGEKRERENRLSEAHQMWNHLEDSQGETWDDWRHGH